MIRLLVQILFVVAGSITSWFVSRDTLHFDIFQMVIAVFLFTLIVFIAAFWPNVVEWYRQTKRNRK